MEELTGTVLEGKYRLVRLLGAGGMGSVYEAQHELISRRVAVKLLLPQLAGVPEMAERFLREARSASAIEHPNIIEIHDVGRSDDGHLFIVMELLEGQSLRDVLTGERKLGIDRAIRITLEVLAGLQAAHQQGTIHRDLKPDNVFLLPADDGSERVKLLDFGISKAKGGDAEGLTQTGAVMGTPHYMAPEQAEGDPDVDERIDLWATGVLLFEMLCGGRPFEGDTYGKVIKQILVDPVPEVHALAPAVPPSLVGVLKRALTKERADRYPNAAAMIADLRAVADEIEALACGETVITPPSTRDATVAVQSTPVQAAPKDASSCDEADDTAKGARAADGIEVAAAGAAPMWKKVLWLLIALPFPLMLLLAATNVPGALPGIIGLSHQTHRGFDYLIASALGLGTLYAAWQIHRFWARGIWNRWLQGLGFLVFPAVGLLLVFRCHTALDGQIQSALASYRAYGTITMAQAEASMGLWSAAWADHLNAVAMVTMLVAYLAMLVLCGHVFAARADGARLFSRRYWLLLPAGIILIIAVRAMYVMWTSTHMPPLAEIVYLLWVLTAVPILRRTQRDAPDARPSAWSILLSGMVAAVAILGVAAAVGFIDMHEGLAGMPTWRRATLWREATGVVQETIVGIGALALTLTILLLIVCRRAFSWGRGQAAERAKQIGLALAMLGTTALSTWILMLDNDAVRIALAMPTWQPAVVEMLPVALEPRGAAGFYIDRNPSTLHRGRQELFVRLGAARSADAFEPAELLKALAGHERCAAVLEATIGPQAPPSKAANAPVEHEPPPARCISAIEARLYCEVRGKRLPTPAEWDAALGNIAASAPVVVERTGPLRRGAFGEWTMKLVHGTPTFHVKGGDAAPEDPGQLQPGAVSEQVGFRCAYTFDR